ncbi:hypothetical protein ACRSA6_006574 [Pseudomonas aeruginosa]|nr:hypothetical protein [Pseudomonas aeruginosa]
MATLPFALSGGIWLLYWFGFNLSVATGVGFIALAGVSAEFGGRRQKLSATPDLSGTVLPLCLIPNSALKNAPPFKSAMPKGSACARLLA